MTRCDIGLSWSDTVQMANSNYYRRQAEVCEQLAASCGAPAIAERLRMMALDFASKAEGKDGSERDEAPNLPDLHVIAGDDPSGGDMDLD